METRPCEMPHSSTVCISQEGMACTAAAAVAAAAEVAATQVRSSVPACIFRPLYPATPCMIANNVLCHTVHEF